MIRKFAYMYIILDLVLILISIYKGGFWLINTQLAFISSMLIVFSSFYGYKKAIKAKSLLFENEEFEKAEDKEIIKKTRKIAGTFCTSLSPFRLLSYVFLILAFLFLNRREWLEIFPFLLGLGIIPIVSVVGGFLKFRE